MEHFFKRSFSSWKIQTISQEQTQIGVGGGIIQFVKENITG